MMEYFGTEEVGNKSALTEHERAGRCYELAGYALLLGKAPKDALLIHGSMHGVRAPHRIEHAWLVLRDERIWEPMQGRFWHADVWRVLARPQLGIVYDRFEVSEMVLKFEHWGPWPN